LISYEKIYIVLLREIYNYVCISRESRMNHRKRSSYKCLFLLFCFLLSEWDPRDFVSSLLQ